MKAPASRHRSPAVSVSSPSSTRTAAELSADDLRHAYRLMLLSRRLDDKEIQLKNQSLIYFQISGAGHEAVLVAAGMTLRAGLRLVRAVLPRPRAVPRARRDAPRHAAAGRRRQGRPGQPAAARCPRTGAAARSTSSRVAARPAPSACRRWAAPRPACCISSIDGIADRDEHFQADEVVFCSLGEGATSEGEFWESLNTASQKRLPVVYLVEDNGYAISVPVEAQTAGGNISRLVERFPAPEGPARGRLRLRRQPRGAPARRCSGRASGRARRWSTPRSRGRTRTRCPTTSACTRRRPSAPTKRSATRWSACARCCWPKAWRPTTTWRPSLAEVDREIAEATDAARWRPTSPRGTPPRTGCFSPDVDPTSAAFDVPRRAARASPTRW